MLAPYDEKKALPLLKPFCKSIVSVKNPLYPVRTEGWEAVSRNDKRSYEATVPGSEIVREKVFILSVSTDSAS